MKKLVAAFIASLVLIFAPQARATPLIAFSINAADIGAPSSFAFSFSLPFVSSLVDGLPVTVLAILDVTVTAGPTGAEASITPNFASLMLNTVGTCAAGVDIGTGFGTPPSPTTQHFQATSTFTPVAGCDDSMTSFVAFTGSGMGALYSIVGRFEINPVAVAEPPTLILLGGTLLAALLLKRRRTA